MPVKTLQVLHLSVAELDPGSEQECLAQLSTSQLCPVTLWALMCWWHHCHWHPSTLPLWALVSYCQVTWAPARWERLPQQDSESLSKRRPSPRSRFFLVLLTWSRWGETSLGQIPVVCSLQRGTGCRPWARTEPQLLPLCRAGRAPTSSTVRCLAVSPDISPSRQPQGEV